MVKIKIKSAKGFEDYLLVSDTGRVWRKGRYVKYVCKNGTVYYKFFKQKEIKPFDNLYGYLTIKFRDEKGLSKNVKVHKLVSETFLDKDYTKKDIEVNHKDHNKYNNNVNNLEFVTRKENMVKMSEYYGKRDNSDKPKKKVKQRKQGKQKYVLCSSCKTNKINEYSKSLMCRECYEKNKREKLMTRLVNLGVNKERLYNLLMDNSFLEVGRMFGVSDNAIRKWCDVFGIPRKTSYYRQYRK